jgi:hypothetical protein
LNTKPENAGSVDATARLPPSAQHTFQFVDQFEWRSRRAVQLVHEREYRNGPPAADLEKLQCLRLDAFAGIDDHYGDIDGGEHAICILGEVSMAWSIEQIYDVVFVFKLKHGGGNGNPPLLFQLHPVACRRPLVLACCDTARKLHRTAVKQQLLRQRRLSCIRMRNDCKGPPAGRLA